jgi:hypothetical protein
MIRIKVLILLVLLVIALPVEAREKNVCNVRWIALPTDDKKIVSQGIFTKGCGFAAVLNCLLFGPASSKAVFKSLFGKTNSERIQYLMTEYGSRPAKEHISGIRLRKDGIGCQDLRDLYNDVRHDYGLPGLSAEYLNRGENETQQQLLKRVHRLLRESLRQGEPPLISLRSETAHWNRTLSTTVLELAGQDPSEDGYLWHGLMAHYVTVVGVPEVPNLDGSFALDYLDPDDGMKRQLLLYSDVRNFAARKGTEKDGEWLRDRPFLAIASGSIHLLTQRQVWSNRTQIYLQFAIYKK